MKTQRICIYCGSIKDVRYNSKAKKVLCAKHSRHIWHYGKIMERTGKDKNEITEKDGVLSISLYLKQKAGKEPMEICKAFIDSKYKEQVSNLKWYLTHNGYVQAHIGSERRILMHHLVLQKKDDMDVDHINQIKHDNRESNLRYATRGENVHNQKKHKGIYYKNNKWEVRIKKNKILYILGRYADKDEAIKVRKEASLRLYGEFAPNETLAKLHENIK